MSGTSRTVNHATGQFTSAPAPDPTPEQIASASHRSDWRDSVLAYEFGGIGKNTDQGDKLQDALDYINSKAGVSGNSDCAGYGGAVRVSPALRLRDGGFYRTSNTLRLGDLGLFGRMALIVCDNPNVPVLEISGTHSVIDGLVLSGGSAHIAVTSGDVGSQPIIRNCIFRGVYGGGPSIVVHPSNHSMQFTIENCNTDCVPLFRGNPDSLSIRNVQASWGVNGFSPEAAFTLPYIDSGNVIIDGLFGVPYFDGNTENPCNPWIRSHGSVMVSNSRFGAEHAGAEIVEYYQSSWYFEPRRVVFRDSSMYSKTYDHNNRTAAWARFLGHFPEVFEVSACVGQVIAPNVMLDEAAIASMAGRRTSIWNSSSFVPRFVNESGAEIESMNGIIAGT